VKLSLPREIAYDAYVEITENKRRPEEVLDEAFRSERASGLRRLDRNFITELVYGSLRWHSKIVWILQNTSKRDLDSTTPEIRTALVIGTYQIFYMDRVPDRAAVNESVEYVRVKKQPNATSFVNGILRQIARRAVYFPKPDKETKPGEYLALQFAHPRWMVDRWLKRFTFEKLEEILSSHNHPPPYTIRMNLIKTPTEKIQELQQELLKREHTHTDRRNLRSAIRIKDSPDLRPESLFGQGYYTFQDEASQLIALLLAPKPGDHIIDTCAGPGGKLSHIYELANGEANIIALERSKFQYQKALDTMKRLGHTENVTWHQVDFLKFEAEHKVDKIIIDAPCTGLGVLRRHPDGKIHKDEKSLQILPQIQRSMLEHALRQLKVGGELVYSVCSFEPEETGHHLYDLLEKYGDSLEVVTPVSVIPNYFKKYVTKENLLLIYSGNQDEMDGFGAFKIRLKKEIS